MHWLKISPVFIDLKILTSISEPWVGNIIALDIVLMWQDKTAKRYTFTMFLFICMSICEEIVLPIGSIKGQQLHFLVHLLCIVFLKGWVKDICVYLDVLNLFQLLEQIKKLFVFDIVLRF